MNTEAKQEVLTHLELRISERIIDVIGTYCNDNWRNLAKKLVETDPTTLASEIATAVSTGITTALTNDETWPNGAAVPTRLNEIVLNAEQVRRVIHCFWYQNAAQFTQLMCERMWFPGWTYDWVLAQVRATGASVHDMNKFNGHSVADGLDFVIIRHDGSGVTVFIDGRRVATPALPVEEQRKEPVSRIGKPKEMYGAYMTSEELTERIAAKQRAETEASETDDVS